MTRTIPLQQFQQDANVAAADADRRAFVRGALAGYMQVRGQTQNSFADYPAARETAAAIKWEAIEHLDALLLKLEKNLTAQGVQVHWARDAAEARQVILDLIQKHDAKHVIKSKTMTSEEIHLNAALEAAGLDVVESDLGEYIVQLNREAPYHFVFPSMHLKRGEIKAIFERARIEVGSDDPEALTLAARRALREKYLRADVGISGANFAVAETGMISITENEGNARLTCALPRVHIALMGIEKVIPRLEDLALLLPMLATAGTGQLLTGYNSLYAGPRRDDEADGPREMHLVLLDNGRTTLLADPEQRDALRCIRCGACLNVCPIFKNVGGHAYGTTYQGPIGSVITPHFRGLDFKHLSFASSLCGACSETCPVGIDLHHHLLRNRRNVMAKKPKFSEKMVFRGFAFVMRRPRLYRFVGRWAGVADRVMKPMRGTALDPFRAWRRTRTLPPPAKRTFADYWSRRA